MRAIRVSATDIDAFRRYIRPPAGFEIELNDLLRQLRKQEPPTPAMRAGSALHKILEAAEDGTLEQSEMDGFVFSFGFDDAVDLPVIREMKATKEYVIAGCVVTLVGKVDAIHGKRIEDHKLTTKYDAERFLSSYQWRLYLDIFDADEFRWNVFEGRETEPGNYVIRAFHPLRMHRYPGMRDDIERELSAFVLFAQSHLPERFTSEAA